MLEILTNATYISLLVQFITGALGFHGLTIQLPKEDEILREVLIMEMIVQVIEFIFYLWLAQGLFSYNKKSDFPLFDVTKRRYIDWFITTPTMLVSTITFLYYLRMKEEIQQKENYENNKNNENEKRLTFQEFVEKHKKFIFTIVLTNAMMLFFGYLVENGKFDKWSGIFIGFIFLFITFYLIYKEFAKGLDKGEKLFMFMFFIWSLYGVAAMFSFYYKNISYNILDIFAKNFFGLFLYWMIITIKNQQNKYL